MFLTVTGYVPVVFLTSFWPDLPLCLPRLFGDCANPEKTRQSTRRPTNEKPTHGHGAGDCDSWITGISCAPKTPPSTSSCVPLPPTLPRRPVATLKSNCSRHRRLATKQPCKNASALAHWTWQHSLLLLPLTFVCKPLPSRIWQKHGRKRARSMVLTGWCVTS